MISAECLSYFGLRKVKYANTALFYEDDYLENICK